jgi:hypothetical protein
MLGWLRDFEGSRLGATTTCRAAIGPLAELTDARNFAWTITTIQRACVAMLVAAFFASKLCLLSDDVLSCF